MLGPISWEQGKGDAPVMEWREKQDAAGSVENPRLLRLPVTGYRLQVPADPVSKVLPLGCQVQCCIYTAVPETPLLLKHER